MMKLLMHELIGKNAKVIDSKNKRLIGIEGKITDETKNMLTIDNKKLIKEQITFILTDSGEKIEGKQITLRPEDRLKKIKKVSK